MTQGSGENKLNTSTSKLRNAKRNSVPSRLWMILSCFCYHTIIQLSLHCTIIQMAVAWGKSEGQESEALYQHVVLMFACTA